MSVSWPLGAPSRVSVAGHDLEYQTFGPKPVDAPTIVMLHEGLGSLSLWRDWPAQVSEATGYGVLVYSRAGYGQSDPKPLPWPLDYMTHEGTVVLPALLDAAGIGHAVLLGHSDGATIAAICAGSTGDQRVRGLILMAPHFFTEPTGLDAIRKARHDFENGDLRERLARHHADPDVAFGGWNGAWLHPDFEDWNVSEVIDYLRVPSLVIQGDADEYGTLAQVREIEERSYAPVDTLILSGCGHAPHRDRPDATLGAITEFAERLRRIEEAQSL